MIRSFPNESGEEVWQKFKVPETRGNVCKELDARKKLCGMFAKLKKNEMIKLWHVV